MKIGAIYYTDNGLDLKMLKVCQKQLRKAFDGDIVSVSLRPINFGTNYVLENRVRSYPTMTTQILMALEKSTADVVFFCEHDVLYHPSHFDFRPTKKRVYYYNNHNWRWRWETDVAITYDQLHSLSGLCCFRKTAIKHYKLRMKKIEELEMDENRAREPRWARRFGYEPGTKPKRRGGITNETFETWKSKYPNIDIRHRRTFSHPKTFRREFKHLPSDFTEVNVYDIPGWNLKEMFK